MSISYNDVMQVLTEIFEDLGDELEIDTDDLAPNQLLLDLGMESISLVYLISELQQHFGLGDTVFKSLRDEGRLLKDMTVKDIVDAVVQVGSREQA